MSRIYVIAIGVVIVAAVLIWYFAKRKSSKKTFTGNIDDGNAPAAPRAGNHANFTPDFNDIDEEIRALMSAGEKIEAIKRVRQKTGLGLKEAKDYVERL